MKTCPVCDTPFPDQHVTCPTDGAVLIESPELAPGYLVRGKYRIVRKLGQGGMGIVYLAEHQLLGGQMALKFLAAELSRNPQFVKRFRNEARAAYQLRHPNIVEVTDLDQDEDGTLFIAMEYVPGASLRTVLREASAPMDVKRALRIVRDVAAGLVAAHARGAVHRDIKPENILLEVEPDGKEQAKILDFGIAAMTDKITNLSHTHGLLLTPEYAAPEQWRGTPASEVDGRTDLYALGGVFFEMLTGQQPFHAVNPEGWMYQHLQGTPAKFAALRPDLAREYPGLEPLVMRLLAREREQRFPSAAAFLEALAPKAAPTPAPPAMQAAPTPWPVAPTGEKPPSATPAVEVTRQPKVIELPRLTKQPTRHSKLAVWITLAVVAIGATVAVFSLRSKPSTDVPIFTQAEGASISSQTLAIHVTTPNATIYYTVDGTLPTEHSSIYSNPLSGLPSGTVVHAMAVAGGHKPSAMGWYIWTQPGQPVPATLQASAFNRGKYAYDHKEYAEAQALFYQACDGGEMRACNYLGYLYAQGLGGPRDAGVARAFYSKACDGGNQTACDNLRKLP
jgi:serine/threonine protein kinase